MSEWVSGWVSAWGSEREWLSEWVRELAWVVEWVGEGASVSGCVSGWGSERLSEWVSDWLSERSSEWMNMSEGAKEWLGKWWVMERLSERIWVRKRANEWVSEWGTSSASCYIILMLMHPLALHLGLLIFDDLFTYFSAIFMFKIVNKKLPSYISCLFQCLHGSTRRNTRDYFLSKVRLEIC